MKKSNEPNILHGLAGREQVAKSFIHGNPTPQIFDHDDLDRVDPKNHET